MDFASEFKLNNDIYYLNHAAVSPWPLRTKKAVELFASQNCNTGSYHYLDWLQNEKQLRKNLAKLINADNDNDIALVKNTSEGLSMVAFGYPWQTGENVVIPSHEFPSNRIVWEALGSKGVEVRQVDIVNTDEPEKALLQMADEKTRIISVSSVHYAHGLRLHLNQIGQYCNENSILFCVDAIQSLGAIQMDVKNIQADFVIADGHKWMLGPEGLALFYSTPEARNKLMLNEYGWHMLESPHDFNQQEWNIAKSAQRFECGSPNMLCAHALLASTELLLEIGMDKIQKLVLANSAMQHSLIETSENLFCTSAVKDNRYAGIVSFKHKEHSSESLYEYLMSQKVMCACRDNSVRFSPHFYTDKEDIHQAIKLADSFTG